MNSFDDIIKWLTLMIPLLISPGPANLTIAALSSRVGFVATLPFIAGILVIDLIVTPVLGFSCGAIFSKYPKLFLGLEMLGIIYIFFLAFGFARSSFRSSTALPARSRTLGFKNGLILQLLNAKLFAMIIMMFTQFLEKPHSLVYEIAILSILFNVGATSCHLLWAQFGTMLNKFTKSSRGQKIQAIAFALSLFLVGFWLFMENLKHFSSIF